MNLSSLSSSGGSRTILMFSGGRDSTLAAIRLNKINVPIKLVTITSRHLEGIDRVHKRLKELAYVLPKATPWLHIEQPDELFTDMSFYDQTCLPCHHAYVVVSAAIAKTINASQMAFGYTTYQNDWPEQTPLAVSRLEHALKQYGIKLILPVYDIATREQAIEELIKNGLSAESLEQKCLRQITNVALSDERLTQQVSLWEKAISCSMSGLVNIPINVMAYNNIGDFCDDN